MPKYNEIKYGKIHKYGKYILSSSGKGTLGEHVKYRIRTRSFDGKISNTIVMCEDRISINSGSPTQIRMRANDGEWIRSQVESIADNTSNVRIRSIKSNGNKSEWVYSDRASLKEI